MMDRNRLEFERIRNLVQGFQWESVREEIRDEYIVMEIRKPREGRVEKEQAPPS